ncbi:trypsin-like peptidase domain-containing protein [Chloroflexi bacterium TSY]|nr:trypsin-like peptidase domain-containing protein [Chloroflexi bacterium TSY]
MTTNILQQLSTDLAGLVESAGPSIVRVEGRRRMSASGVVWTHDGEKGSIIVTANHVVERDENIRIGSGDGNAIEASLIGRDPTTDLALLRAKAADLAAASWLESDALGVGHLVLAMGRPGRTVQATLGVVSALGGKWRTSAGGEIDHYLQTDVTMYPGFSGGPLVVADGKVAGINSSALLRGISMTIPATSVQRIVEALLEHGHMPRGYLGVGIQPVRLPDELQQSLEQETGLMVMSVEADASAAKAGMLQGDILVQLDSQPVRHIDDLQTLLSGDRVGKETTVAIVRGGRTQELAITIGQK